MTKPKFVYVTYIAATPEKVWQALTDGEMTKEYWWHHANVSDWKVGSAWQHQDYDDPKLVDIAGTVVESKPPHRLVVTWALPADAGNDAKASRVTYQIERWEDVVRLTVMHEELEPDSDMLRGITSGWPAVLSSLKTFLETGKPMSTFTQRRSKAPE
jgi:uncharacterized protein YndB with AHSA1/START domain